MKKVFLLFIVLAIMVFATSCSTTRGAPPHVTMISSSDLVLGDRIEVSGSFPFSGVNSKAVLQELTVEAVKNTDYDFVFMPTLYKNGNMITLRGRLARLK